MSTPAGKRNRYVEIQRFTTQSDAGGHREQKWVKVGNEWVSIKPIGGSEVRRDIQVEAGVTTIVDMLYREDVTAQMRIVDGKQILNIERAYDPDGRRASLWCQCKEVA